tara:strand:- start:424 stop:633 length:210 start_codon:yes stop_codon:yes gene_type:complete
MKIGDLVKRNEAAASQCRRRYKIGIVINVQKMYIKNNKNKTQGKLIVVNFPNIGTHCFPEHYLELISEA